MGAKYFCRILVIMAVQFERSFCATTVVSDLLRCCWWGFATGPFASPVFLEVNNVGSSCVIMIGTLLL